MMLILCRIALAVVVLTLVGCDAGADRVYDDTTLRLTAYVAPRPGEVVLEWTGGPSGVRRWEYYTLGPGSPLPGVWRDVPSDRVGPTSRRMRLDLEPGAGYLFKIRERGDPRDPAETNPAAVARVSAPGVGEHRLTSNYNQPLEPGARFWLVHHELWVRAPPEGMFIVSPYPMCLDGAYVTLWLTLDNDGREVQVHAALWVLPPHSDREEWAAILETPGLLDVYEFRQPPGQPPGLTVRELAEQAGTPGERAAYRLLVDAIESMFNGYPPTVPESLWRGVRRVCI
jgi:hypothetical protein